MSTALNKYFKHKKALQSHSRPKRSSTLPQEHNSRKSTIDVDSSQALKKASSVHLPKLSDKLMLKEEECLNNIYNSRKQLFRKNKYEIKPMRMNTPVRLLRNNSCSSSGPSYLTMPSTRSKLTDQYFTQIDNIRLAERLLLMKPSKQLCKSTHKQFYQQQKKYKKNMQVNKSVSRRGHSRIGSQDWVGH